MSRTVTKTTKARRFYATTLLLFATAAWGGTVLRPETRKAWDDYVRMARDRAESRARAGLPFLWVDESPERLRRVREGNIEIAPASGHGQKNVPFGLVHDWMGAIFLRGARLTDVIAVVRDYDRYKEFYTPVVVDSKALPAAGPDDRFSMLWMNKVFFLSTALETEYDTNYIRSGEKRATLIARTRRVQEVVGFGSPDERKLNDGEGNGYIWQLFSVSRIEERDGGVYLELEVIALSRDVPISLRWMMDPIIRRVSKNSLTISLSQTRDAVAETRKVAHRPGSNAVGY